MNFVSTYHKVFWCSRRHSDSLASPNSIKLYAEDLIQFLPTTFLTWSREPAVFFLFSVGGARLTRLDSFMIDATTDNTMITQVVSHAPQKRVYCKL